MKKSIFVMIVALFAVLALPTEAEAQRTGVYVNNYELNPYDLQMLTQLTGPLYQGFYYIDQAGNFGVVGYYPSLNLYQVAQNLGMAQNQNRSAGSQYQQRGSNNGEFRYQNDPASSGYYWQEGNASGWSNSNTGSSITTDGTLEGTIIYSGGEMLDLPPY